MLRARSVSACARLRLRAGPAPTVEKAGPAVNLNTASAAISKTCQASARRWRSGRDDRVRPGPLRPDSDYHGPDSFTYTISDGRGGTNSATVSITVSSVNDDPHAVDDELTTARDTAGEVNVLANDTDVDGDTLSVTGSTDGAHGTVACTGAGVCTYTPATGYSGPDSFTYTVSDGHGGTATGTVTVTVYGIHAGPHAQPLTASNPLGTEHTVTATLTSGGVPLADISVSFSAVTGPHAGTTGSDVTDAEGKATFSYTGTIAGTDTLRASATVAPNRSPRTT